MIHWPHWFGACGEAACKAGAFDEAKQFMSRLRSKKERGGEQKFTVPFKAMPH